ncbi:MAG TPA: IS630 family transposase [Solirubrobacteraceae bacterium]|nr:IS630 family transposase [Solirubrobacteraceae bacterium]
MLTAVRTELSGEQRALLERWAKAHGTPQSVAMRARIVLMASDGESNSAIARELGVSRPTVIMWRERFAAGGPQALSEVKAGRGRKRTISHQKVNEIVFATTQTTPPGETHWSCRSMAKAQGVSPASVQRIWDAHGLKPHRVKTFKVSNDPLFTEKLTDVVGLYLNPPEKALVLCVDEKSQIQALDRTQASLPMKPGRAGTMTHDYKRNGTTTLFAAMNTLDGSVIGQCLPRHRHQEFLKFLRTLDRAFPEDVQLHLIVDNYRTHKHANVNNWLEKHPRFHLHFTPTSSSWLNLVERWFRELTDKAIRRGVFYSVPDLITAIDEYLKAHNDDPKPFVWTASIDSILEKVGRCKAVLETVH